MISKKESEHFEIFHGLANCDVLVVQSFGHIKIGISRPRQAPFPISTEESTETGLGSHGAVVSHVLPMI